MHTCVYIYIYIYIYRERERERYVERDIYTYMCIYSSRVWASEVPQSTEDSSTWAIVTV